MYMDDFSDFQVYTTLSEKNLNLKHITLTAARDCSRMFVIK